MSISFEVFIVRIFLLLLLIPFPIFAGFNAVLLDEYRLLFRGSVSVYDLSYYGGGGKGSNSVNLDYYRDSDGLSYRAIVPNVDCNNEQAIVNAINLWSGSVIGPVTPHRYITAKQGQFNVYCDGKGFTIRYSEYISVGPGTPVTTCSANKNYDIDFGEFKSTELNGRRAEGSVVLKCTGSSTVTASFTSPFGKKSDNIRDDIIGEYSINGSSPNKYSMRKDVPVTINPRIVLSSNGVVTGGAFYGFGVLKINYE
ncbi:MULTISPECIES: hypothetical protein [Serratia]|jgi:hypothetical protein|uniref:hypothetical protein n=1 Tax=Serratia TaxID=613 RepID=UPI0021B7ACE9|nr:MULTISPECIES: hypothetical protein [Serratia]